MDVRLDAFEWVVFGCRDNLCCGRMHYVVYAIESPVKALFVPDITDEESDPVVSLEFLGHVPLFHLVAGVDDNLLGVEVGLVC